MEKRGSVFALFHSGHLHSGRLMEECHEHYD